MGSAEMRRRFARARLGQVWIMLSSALLVSSMGLVWSFLWKQPVGEMLPFIAIGMMVWQLLTSVLNDSALAFPANSHYFLNQYMSASTIIYAVLYRNGVTFLLNMIYPLVLCIVLGNAPNLYTCLTVVGLACLTISCFLMGYVIAILCARFRDIVQILTTFLQVIFFVTPVLWKPEFLPLQAHQLLAWNPFALLIAIVRDPLLGRPVSGFTWISALGLALFTALVALPFIGKFSRRVVYWL